jgi:hypothetical protein
VHTYLQPAQDVAAQLVQEDPLDAADLKSPAALLKQHADINRLTSPPHTGQVTVSLPKTSSSNCLSHRVQLNS